MGRVNGNALSWLKQRSLKVFSLSRPPPRTFNFFFLLPSFSLFSLLSLNPMSSSQSKDNQNNTEDLEEGSRNILLAIAGQLTKGMDLVSHGPLCIQCPCLISCFLSSNESSCLHLYLNLVACSNALLTLWPIPNSSSGSVTHHLMQCVLLG